MVSSARRCPWSGAVAPARPERQARRQTSRWHKLSALRAKTCFTAGLQNHSIGDHTVADMKTSLTDEQLADPAIAEADRILNTCQHFGFCTAGCPTSAARRERWPARPHRSDQGNAGKPASANAADRCAHRPMSFLHVVHDHLRGQSRLHAPGRHGARAHRGELPASSGATHRPGLARPCIAAPRLVPDGAGPGPPGQALFGGAAILPAQRIAPDSRTTPGRPPPIPLSGPRRTEVARRLAGGLRAARARRTSTTRRYAC